MVDQTAGYTYLRTINDVRQDSRQEKVRFGWLAGIDKPLLLLVVVLLTIGCIMVLSTTFDWSLQSRGSSTSIFVQDHLRNVAIGLVAMFVMALIDYRFWKRLTVPLLAVTIGALVAVLIFGDDTFGARRSLIGGRFQPGELAEFTIIVYLAAWMGSRPRAVRTVFKGLIPFMFIVGLLAGLIALQPDLSSSVIIGVTALMMYFVAGARVTHLVVMFCVAAFVGALFVQSQPYAQDRLASYQLSLTDPTQANYHTQQAIIAFVKGGWTGVGLGQGEQKFGFLPAPHTDSIFAVIGEETGVLGALLVVLLFIAFVIRGFQIARKAVDSFGSIMVIGFTLWVAAQALMNIAVMTAVIPSTGVPLPFISYGGSSLVVLMIGVGLIFSVARVSARREAQVRRKKRINYEDDMDRSRWNRRSRLSGAGSR